MKYDFILFETLYNSVNHYKDVCHIAKMLNDGGYNVAIADVFREDEFCHVDGVPVIHPFTKTRVPLQTSNSRYSIIRVISNLWKRFLIDLYLCRVIKCLSQLAPNIYGGTMVVGMPFLWLFKIPRETKVFFWGLRSYFLTYHKQHDFRYETISSKIIDYYFHKEKNRYFFVSDEIIKEEFEKLDIEPERLIIRPERVTKKCMINPMIYKKDYTVLLIIGSLRPDKHIDKCINVLKQLKDRPVKLIVAGKASKDYGYDVKTNELCATCANVERIDKRLSDEEYFQLIDSCDYLMLCDKKQLSSVTNGTMNEALLAGRPIIAPNYNPYEYIVEKYQVGILYDFENPASLKTAISKACDTDYITYKRHILQYQQTLLDTDVQKEFCKAINIVVSK